MKELCCNHVKQAKDGYIYSLIGATLNLCRACEKRLRKEISKQAEFEEDLG